MNDVIHVDRLGQGGGASELADCPSSRNNVPGSKYVILYMKSDEAAVILFTYIIIKNAALDGILRE